MSLTWKYPVFVVPNQGGFASATDNEGLDRQQSLLMFSENSAAVLFIASFNLLSAPRPINNDRELGWLLRSVQFPVTQILLDANPQNPESASGTVLQISEILENLNPDLSPWNYPVFALATDVGFVTIDGAADDGEFLSALAIFSDERAANKYQEQSGDKGELCELANREDTIVFLKGVASMVGAVALDPQVNEGRHSARYCFAIDTLLNKYLVDAKLKD